jgi:hypothetical protein
MPSGGNNNVLGKRIPLNLGALSTDEDGHWFRFDDGTPADSVVRSATYFLAEADRWWEEAK